MRRMVWRRGEGRRDGTVKCASDEFIRLDDVFLALGRLGGSLSSQAHLGVDEHRVCLCGQNRVFTFDNLAESEGASVRTSHTFPPPRNAGSGTGPTYLRHDGADEPRGGFEFLEVHEDAGDRRESLPQHRKQSRAPRDASRANGRRKALQRNTAPTEKLRFHRQQTQSAEHVGVLAAEPGREALQLLERGRVRALPHQKVQLEHVNLKGDVGLARLLRQELVEKPFRRSEVISGKPAMSARVTTAEHEGEDDTCEAAA